MRPFFTLPKNTNLTSKFEGSTGPLSSEWPKRDSDNGGSPHTVEPIGTVLPALGEYIGLVVCCPSSDESEIGLKSRHLERKVKTKQEVFVTLEMHILLKHTLEDVPHILVTQNDTPSLRHGDALKSTF